MDFERSAGREAFAYAQKDSDLAFDGFEGKRWVMLIDLRKCVGCQACTVACKFENNIPEGSFRTWVPDVEIGVYPDTRRAFLPRLCNHCERPSCIEVCPADATWQRKDGIVEIDYDKCWGCGSCVNACPYDARFINPVTKTADKCTFCSQRVDQGLLPACVETCIGGSRQFGDLNDPNDPVTRQIKSESVQTLKPGTGNQPRVFYIRPSRFASEQPPRPPDSVVADVRGGRVRGTRRPSPLESGRSPAARRPTMANPLTTPQSVVPVAPLHELLNIDHSRPFSLLFGNYSWLLGAAGGCDQFKDSLRAEEWPKVLSVLAKGGRMEPRKNARQGDKLTHRFTKTLHFYAEEVAQTRNSMTGERFLGTTAWVEPATAFGKTLDKLDDAAEWPLTIITFKGALQSHSRLASNYALRQIMPDNGIQVAAEDARRLGIRDGEKVWVVTPHGKRQGTARVVEGIRPGVVTFNVGYGHWGYGATNYQVGGARIEGDRVRRAGIHLNPIMRRDPDVEQMTLMDLVGGSVVFFNTRARLEKAVANA